MGVLAGATSVEAPDLQTKVRGLIRYVDLTSFPANAHSEYVAGPASGVESAYLIVSRLPAGASGSSLHTHSSDKIYFVLEGTMTVQLGLNTHKVGANTFIIIPAGMVHCNWNEDEGAEKHLTFLIPEPPKDTAWDVLVDIKGDVTVSA